MRVKSVLKLSQLPKSEFIFHYVYQINITKREIVEGTNQIELTNKEFELLIFFLNHINQAFDRETILKQVWGDNYYGSDRVVDDLLRRLRQKMPNLKIETIYGYGYRLL